jgi:ribulose-phosphate 3-epimerase
MIEKPERYLQAFADAGADWLGVHVETCVHLHRTIQNIKELGRKASVSLNPATPLCGIENVLDEVDMVLLMTVNPGFGGQKFIPAVLSKVGKCRAMIDERRSPALLQVDGGVHQGTIDDLVDAGVDVFVAGSAVFANGDCLGNVKVLKDRMNRVDMRKSCSSCQAPGNR